MLAFTVKFKKNIEGLLFLLTHECGCCYDLNVVVVMTWLQHRFLAANKHGSIFPFQRKYLIP